MLCGPIAFAGDPQTAAMLARAVAADGPDREALAETHGQVSLDRAPHQALRRAYGAPAAR